MTMLRKTFGYMKDRMLTVSQHIDITYNHLYLVLTLACMIRPVLHDRSCVFVVIKQPSQGRGYSLLLKHHLHWFFPLKMQWRISLRAGYISSWWLDIFIMSNTVIAEKVYLGKKVQKNWTSHFFQKAGNISLLIFRFWFFHNISNFIIC